MQDKEYQNKISRKINFLQERKHPFFRFLFVLELFVFIIALPQIIINIFTRKKIYHLHEAPTKIFAIVFGAGIHKDGTPTSVLKDRVFTASQLYFSGKTDKLLMSGTKHQSGYNEPLAMFNYACSLGVPEKDIILDFEGLRTYDTCFRAKHFLGIQEALLVTQRFHLPRAILISNMMGINCVGIISDRRRYHPVDALFWKLREIPATIVAIVDILNHHHSKFNMENAPTLRHN